MASRTVLGTCHHDCPDSCGWEVTVDDGVAVRLRGNPDHPYSQGELCPKVNRFLARVYAPDRVLRPLLRNGPKGSGQFREATWDEALAVAAQGLRRVRDTYGGEAILPWSSAGTQGLIQSSSLDRRLFAALGASRTTGSLCGATAATGTALTYGSGHGADPLDVAHAEVVLLWGTNTRLTNRHLWPYVERARANGATVIVVDPLRTITAESADWFVQPFPGTDVALILGMLHVLVRDDLVDHDYVHDHATGFADLAAHVAEWTPARAAAECGVDADVIERLARRYGSTRRAFIRTLIGAEHHHHGAMTFRALACLPVVTGAWRVRGGGLARSTGVWSGTHIDEDVFDAPDRPRTRSVNANQLGRALEDPAAGIHALVVWGGNPATSAPNAGAVRRGLARDDLFTIVSEQFCTDTARYADVVFPATTQIEHLDVVPSWGSLHLGWNEPAIAPVGEAVPNTELWRRLARALGIEDPMFDLDDEALVRLALHDLDVDALRARGRARHDLPEPLLPYEHGGFATADGRAALRNDALGSLGLPALPTHTPVSVAPGELRLLTPKTHPRFLNTSYSHHHGPLEPAPCLELSAEDADALGLPDGAPATVANGRGTLTLPARRSVRVRPGLCAIPWGWWGQDRAVNVLTDDTVADAGGGGAYYGTRVRVSPAGAPA